MDKKKDGLVKQGNNKKKPATGFHTNPERINKKGRPPAGESWAEILRQIGEEVDPKSGKQFKEAVGRKVWKLCLEGNVNVIKELFNRMDGMPLRHVDITSDGEKIESPVIFTPKRSAVTIKDDGE